MRKETIHCYGQVRGSPHPEIRGGTEVLRQHWLLWKRGFTWPAAVCTDLTHPLFSLLPPLHQVPEGK